MAGIIIIIGSGIFAYSIHNIGLLFGEYFADRKKFKWFFFSIKFILNIILKKLIRENVKIMNKFMKEN